MALDRRISPLELPLDRRMRTQAEVEWQFLSNVFDAMLGSFRSIPA
jgi:hypothetical protein